MNYIGRVSEQHHNLYQVICGEKQIQARVSGKLAYQLGSNIEYPVVGDYVALDRDSDVNGTAIINEIKQRKSMLQRTEAGKTGRSQVIAVNVDYIFICMSLNQDYNLRKLERYLAVVNGANIVPIVVLTKADLCNNVEEYIGQIKENNKQLEVIVCSSELNIGYHIIKDKITDGITAAFIGSSGVGKSTLINHIVGKEILRTNDIRENDGRGKHTTTHRQLIQLPNGGSVIDTPGMRELALDDSNVEETFADIDKLAMNCRFSDCSHKKEPGCAVRIAIEDGQISDKRVKNYMKLKQEEIARQRRKKAGHSRRS